MRDWGFCSSPQRPLDTVPPRGPPISARILVRPPIHCCMRLVILLLINSSLSQVCFRLFLCLISISIWQSTLSHFLSLYLGRNWILMVIYRTEYFTVLGHRLVVFRQINTSDWLSLKINSQSTHLGWFNGIAFVILSSPRTAERRDQWLPLAMVAGRAYILVNMYF